MSFVSFVSFVPFVRTVCGYADRRKRPSRMIC
jgi:hypothetical protein